MRRRRLIRVFRARRQRAETSRKTSVLFRYTLLSLGTAVFSIALVSAAAFLFTRSEEAPFLARSDSAEVPFLARSDAAMTRMMAAMKIKPSNNVDRDFALMMVPHHQGAIDMAEAELSYGHNALLRRLAQEIIVTQKEEIAEMRLALVSAAASPSTRPEEAPFLARNDVAMARMMAAMQIKPSHDVDRDFALMMVPHHQGAIDMAEAELSYGHNEPLLGLAQEIIATQEQEIAVMRRALGEPLPASVPASHQPSSSSRYLLSYDWTPMQYAYATGGLI